MLTTRCKVNVTQRETLAPSQREWTTTSNANTARVGFTSYAEQQREPGAPLDFTPKRSLLETDSLCRATPVGRKGTNVPLRPGFAAKETIVTWACVHKTHAGNHTERCGSLLH